jgi:hypothetical protein
MGKLRHGFTTTWGLGLIMMRLVVGVLLCYIALMVAGKWNLMCLEMSFGPFAAKNYLFL